MKPSHSNLKSISPIDGRYHQETLDLQDYFSEFAYFKYRVFVEIMYLLSLSDLKIIRKIKKIEKEKLILIIKDFSITDAVRIKKFEGRTKHDVKAIEYFLKEKLKTTSLNDVSSYVHFGLTSEDINNIAQRLMLKDANSKVILPEIKKLNNNIYQEYKKYKKLPMLARSHGQPAVPTALGKEFLVFHARLKKEIKYLEKHKFNGKINGAIGNYNALYFTYPNINWKKFSRKFLKNIDLNENIITTQISPYEDIIYFFQTIQRINGIIQDLNQDLWRYISDDYFTQKDKKDEVGSSTMPQKINPISFENSEGNIVIANSLIDGYVNKLPVSRLQRDLSGSTISRNFGITLAHSFLAYKNTEKGLMRLSANKEKIQKDLNSDWSILAEAIQTYLKKEGIENGYEILKKQTRSRRLNQEDYQKLVKNLPINNKQKNELLKLTPENYLGLY